MLRLLRWIVTGDGHAHRYEIHKVLTLHDTRSSSDLPEAYVYISRCTICGKLVRNQF